MLDRLNGRNEKHDSTAKRNPRINQPTLSRLSGIALSQFRCLAGDPSCQNVTCLLCRRHAAFHGRRSKHGHNVLIPSQPCGMRGTFPRDELDRFKTFVSTSLKLSGLLVIARLPGGDPSRGFWIVQPGQGLVAGACLAVY